MEIFPRASSGALDRACRLGTKMGAQIILVVEDEVLIRMFTAEALRDEGYQIIEAANGDEGMEIRLSGLPIDLIITDVRMPGQCDGMGLAIFSKRNDPDRPIIMASGHLTAKDISGPDEFITKPYDYSTLLSLVIKLIGPPCSNNDQKITA